MTRVVVNGAAGRMGRQTCEAVMADEDLTLVAAVDRVADCEYMCELAATGTAVTGELAAALEGREADVVVDFTHASAVVESAVIAAGHDCHVVIGTTGISPEGIEELKRLCSGRGINMLLAPNFAMGAVLMMRFAQEAAKYADRAEIIELHHDAKADAPSGTALLTAEKLAAVMHVAELDEEEKLPGARGASVDGIHIHSVRLPGLVAHQEVVMGFPGQTLTIRHDSIDRSSFMPGVVFAVKEIANRPGFTLGLDDYMFSERPHAE